MTRIVQSLSSLIFSIILLVSGNAFLMTLLGVRMSVEALGTTVIGWVLVCYSVGFVFGTLFGPRIVERAGHIRAFAVFCSMLAATALIYPFAVEAPLWAVLRGVGGFAMAGLMLVMESWFSATATNRNRATLFAVYQVIFFLSTAGGQLLINVGDIKSFEPFSVAALLLVLALVPLSMTRRAAPHIESARRMAFSTLFRTAPSGLIGALVGGLMISSFYAMGPVYANQIGLEAGKLSTFMAIAIVTAMIFAWPVGLVCDRFNRRRVLMVVAAVAGGSSLLAAFFGPLGFSVLLPSVGIFMGLAAAIYPIAVAITNDRMEHHEIVPASTTLLLSYGVGSCIGPVVSSAAMSLLGPMGLFIGNAAILVLLCGVLAYRIESSADVPLEEQEHYIPTPADSAGIIAEIDPRNEEFHEFDQTWEAYDESAHREAAHSAG
ncbi:MFS transporter [Marinobacteraceae bacterium S3BR75-40.1]